MTFGHPVGDWLIRHVTFLGIFPLQNWMVVTFALALTL